MDLSRGDLRFRGVDNEIIDTVIKEVVAPRSDSKRGLIDTSEIYHGAELRIAYTTFLVLSQEMPSII